MEFYRTLCSVDKEIDLNNCMGQKEQGSLGIKNGPVSKFNEIGKVAQQHYLFQNT